MCLADPIRTRDQNRVTQHVVSQRLLQVLDSPVMADDTIPFAHAAIVAGIPSFAGGQPRLASMTVPGPVDAL